MFPKTLDNAKVLYFTPKDDYGKIYCPNGETADEIKYLAIAEYPNGEKAYYLFRCDENFEVVGDSVWDGVDKCMSVANSSYGGNIVWIKAD